MFTLCTCKSRFFYLLSITLYIVFVVVNVSETSIEDSGIQFLENDTFIVLPKQEGQFKGMACTISYIIHKTLRFICSIFIVCVQNCNLLFLFMIVFILVIFFCLLASKYSAVLYKTMSQFLPSKANSSR